MALKSVPVVPAGTKWAVKSGSKNSTSEHRTQAAAIKAGRKPAREEKAKFVVHGRTGEIRAKDSYGHDPHPPKG